MRGLRYIKEMFQGGGGGRLGGEGWGQPSNVVQSQNPEGELWTVNQPQGCPHQNQEGWCFLLQTCQFLGKGLGKMGLCGDEGDINSQVFLSLHMK